MFDWNLLCFLCSCCTSFETCILVLAALSGDMSKLLLAAKKIRRATCTEFIISLVSDDFSWASNTYVGKLRLVSHISAPYL